jgi:hydroxymethylbilane synthase
MASLPKRLRIATRESRLAMRQTTLVAEAIRARHPGIAIEVVAMTTRGDRVQDRPLRQVGGKGLFVKELESALEDDRADIAVHSLKDVPMVVGDTFAIATFGAREDPFDAFVSNHCDSPAGLAAGAVVGTSSLRRECQLRHYYPQLELRSLRGNVDTRLAKLDARDYDAIILAAAGLRRLGLEARIRSLLPEAQAIPAIAQGILAVEHRSENRDVAALLREFEDPATAAAARAERSLGLVVEGSCEVPVGALARVRGEALTLEAFIGMPDGSRLVREKAVGTPANAEKIGRELGERLLASGGRAILDALAKQGAAA